MVSCGDMRAISVSNLVELFDQVHFLLATTMNCHDNCGIRFVLCAAFSEISEFRPGP